MGTIIILNTMWWIVSQVKSALFCLHGNILPICESVDDFEEGIVYGTDEAKKHYCNYYVSEFKDVRPFVSDFKGK